MVAVVFLIFPGIIYIYIYIHIYIYIYIHISYSIYPTVFIITISLSPSLPSLKSESDSLSKFNELKLAINFPVRPVVQQVQLD